jgi:hypothetical protein
MFVLNGHMELAIPINFLFVDVDTFARLVSTKNDEGKAGCIKSFMGLSIKHQTTSLHSRALAR